MLVNLNCYAKCRADPLIVCVLVRSKGFEGNHTLFTANGSQGSRRDQCFARVVAQWQAVCTAPRVFAVVRVKM